MQRWSDWIKEQELALHYLQETNFKYNVTNRLKVIGWTKIYHPTLIKRKPEWPYYYFTKQTSEHITGLITINGQRYASFKFSKDRTEDHIAPRHQHENQTSGRDLMAMLNHILTLWEGRSRWGPCRITENWDGQLPKEGIQGHLKAVNVYYEWMLSAWLPP